jgi:hypothetical protein
VTLDFIFSVGIFMAILLILFPLWATVRTQLFTSTYDRELARIVLGVSSSLVEGPGSPTNWQFSSFDNATAYGLAFGRNRLMYGKMLNFTSMNATNYTRIKQYLGAGRYEMNVKLLYLNDTVLNDSGSSPPLPLFFGLTTPSNETVRYTSQAIERLVLVNQSLYKLRVEVWRNITT